MENKFFVIFNADGFLAGSYQSAAYDDPDSLIPAEAIELSEATWRDLYDNKEYRRYVSGHIVEYTPPPPPPVIPQVVSRFQARAALHLAGHLPAVEAAIESADPLTQMAWADAQEFRRNSQTILALAGVLGLSESDVDELFIAASGIVV